MKTIHLLLIEDNPSDARFISEMLMEISLFQSNLVSVLTLKEGCDQIQKNSFDIILLDLNLPDSTGHQTLEKVLGCCKEVPVVLITGNEDEELSLKMIKDGAQDYFTKQSLSPALLGKSILYSIERKENEKKLRESQKLLDEAQKLAHLGVWSWDADVDCVIWTEELYQIAGIDPKLPAPTYTEHSTLYTPRSWHLLNKAVTEALKTGELYQLELELIRPDGKIRNVIAFGGAKVNDKEKIIGLFGTVQDITELIQAKLALIQANKELELQNKEKEKRAAELIIANNELTFQNAEKEKRAAELIAAKEKAEESDHLKTAFLHNISHEIRTPMNAIVGFSEFLSEPELLPEKRNHFTDIITKSCYQLLSIISDIISIAAIEAGQVRITEKEIDLNSSLKLLHEQFLLKEDQKQNVCLTLKHLLPDDEANIMIDETKLVQVLTNLIGNALKFTVQGSVNFGYSVKGNELEFFVEDTGIGISPELHGIIFERFRQVEGTAQLFGGSGLGLSISKAYVELLGGKMWLKSDMGKGSTFYFTLPYKKAQKGTLTGKQSVKDIKIKDEIPRTLLVAEDEDSNFMLMKEVLSGLNINIIKAINGIEAVNICKSNQGIDLVLMDLKMPLMDGYEATRRIREFLPSIPIIAQTAYSEDIDRNKALACGCTDFISKPFKRELLMAKINEQLNKA